MCKLIVGVATVATEEKTNEIKRVLKMQKGDLFAEPHGIAAMVVSREGKVKIWRDLKDYDMVFDNFLASLDTAKFFIVHTRTSTGGSGEKNVHLFEDKGCVMAHNGTISKYSAWKWEKGSKTLIGNNDAECDTLQFLKDLPKPFTANDINALATEKEFHGIAVTYDKASKRAFLICTRTADVIADPERTFAMFLSYTPDKEVKTEYWENMFGVRVDAGEETEKLGYVPVDSHKGVFEITF